MNKFEGLKIEKLHKEENSKKTIKTKKFSKFSVIRLCTLMAMCAICIIGSFGSFLSPVKKFFKNQFNYDFSSALDFESVETFFSKTFGLTREMSLDKLEKMTIHVPFIASEVKQDGNALIFKNNDTTFLKAGFTSKVTKIDTNFQNRIIEISYINKCVLRYEGLRFIGIKLNSLINSNDIFASVVSDVKITMLYNEKEIPIKLNDSGCIEWVN